MLDNSFSKSALQLIAAVLRVVKVGVAGSFCSKGLRKGFMKENSRLSKTFGGTLEVDSKILGREELITAQR